MPILIRLPNGQIHRFPDGTTDAEIQSALGSMQQSELVENSNFVAQAARIPGRIAGGLMSTLGTAIDAAQLDVAPDAVIGRDNFIRNLPFGDTFANAVNRAPEIGNTILAQGGKWAASGADALGLPESVGDTMRAGAQEFENDNTRARAEENRQRQAAGMPTLEQENAMLPANALGKVVTDAGRATTDFFTSDETRAQEQDLSTAWQKPGLMPTIEHIASDPFGFANVMAPAIGESMVGAGLVGRIAKTGLMGMATAEAEAAGARMLASGADDLAVTAAKSEGLIAGTVRANSIQRDVVLAEQTLQVSEMNARQSRDAIMLASEEELQRNPVYRNLASELGPEAARQELARRVFDGTFAANLPIAAATTVIPGRAGLMPVEMRLAGVTPKPGLFGATEGIKGRLGRAAVQGSKEAGGEFVQEMGDQLAGNVAGVHNATADSYTQDVLKAGVVGVAGGFTPGAISGLFTSPAAQQGASEADGLLQTAYAAAATIVPPVQQQQQPPVQGEPAGASAQALTVENWTSRGGRETRVNVSDSTVEGSAGAISFEVRRDAEDRAPLQMWVTRDGKLTERGKAFTAEGEQVNLWNNGTPEQKAQVVALLRERGNHAIGSPERKGIDQQIAAVVTGPQQDAASTSANPLPNGSPIGAPSPTTSAVPPAPPPVQLDSRPAPVAAPQNLPAPLDTPAASTAQPAEPAAQPALGDLGLTTPADPLEQQLLAAGAAPVLAPRVPLMGDATGATDGQANPLETGRMDVPVQPGAATAPAPVSGDAAGAPQAGVNAPPAPVGGQSPSATDSVPAAGQGSETQASVSTLAGGQSQASQPEGVGPVNERLRTHARRLQAGITAALTASNRGRKGGSKVRVFYSAKDAIAAGFDVQDDQDGFYEPTTGTIGVIADQTDSLARGLWVALHEQSGHHGLRETFNNDAALEAELGRAGTNPIVRAVAEAMQRDRANRGRMEDALAVEEALAELEAAVKTGDWSEIKDRYGVEASDLAKSEVGGVMRRMLRAIRAAISRVAGSSSAYSNEDVMALLENAHRAGLRSRRGYNGRNEQRSSTRRLAEDGRLPADGSRVEPVRERMGDASPEGGVDGQRADGVRRGASQRDGARPGARLAGARSRVRLRGYNERMRDIDGPDPKLVAVAEQYARENGIRLRRQREYAQVDPERAARIADAYAAMPHAPNDPAVREAYAELIRQTTAQYRALEQAGYKFWLFDPDNDPYAGNPASALRDLRATQTMGVYPTAAGFGSDASFDPSDNPLLADTGIRWPYGSQDGELRTVYANDLFRAVHDAFGHGLEGAGFRAQGEENAWQAHVRLFTGSAVAAITSETRGQNSWLNYGPAGESNRTAPVEETVFADQKTGIMPEWTWTEGRVADQESRNDRPQRTLASTARRSDAAGNRRARGVAAPQGRGSSGEAWHGRAPRPGAVNVRGIHYSNTAGLKALAGSKYGTNHRGAEARRLNDDAWRDDRYEVLKNRVYFYPDDSKLAARGETMVGRAAVYEQSFDNIYDSETDPRDLWDMASERSDEDGVSVGGAFEYIVHKAGYDGYRTDDMMVVIGRKAVPVTPLKTKASTRKPTINEMGMYSAVEKAVLEMPLPAWKKEDGSAAGADVWAKLRTMPGVKQEELKWLGIEDFLLYPHSSQETAPPKFTREKVAEFVRNNGVNIELVLADQMAMDEDAEFNWREEADMDPSNWDGRSEDMMYEFNAQNGRRADDLWWWDWSDWIDDNQDKIQEALGEDLDAYSVEEYESDGRTYYGVIARGHEIRSEFLTEDDAQAFIEGLVDQHYSFYDIKNHPNGGMDVLIDLAREDAEAKAEEAAEREYMDEPYYTMSDRETGIEAYGNNDIGWTVRGPDGEDIADSVHSVSEVEVQARQWLVDQGRAANSNSLNAAKWGDYVTPGSHDNYREYKLTLPDNPGDPFVYDSHFDDENIVAFLRVTDRKKVAEGDPPVQAPPMPDDWARPGAAREKGITVAKLNEALADLARGERPEWVMPYVRDQHASIEEVTRIVRATLDEHQAAWERENTPTPVRRDGVPTFFIDEFQSDWHQHGRKDGYEGDGSKEKAKARFKEAEAEFDAAQAALFNARDAAVEALVAGGVEDFHAREAVAKMRGGDIDMDVGRALGYAFANGLPNSGVTPELGATLYAYGKAAEVQQAARDKKYRLQNIPNPVPDVPFKSDGWISLGLKTAIIEAVKTGKKALAWADAQVVAERWSDRYIKAYTSQYNEKMPGIVKKLTGQTPKHMTLGGEAYPTNVVSPVEYDKQLDELGDKEQSIEDRLQALPGFPRPTTQQALQYFVAGNPEAMALQSEAQQVRNEIGALKDKYRKQTLPQGYWVIPITEEVEAKVAQGLPTFSSTRRRNAVEFANGQEALESRLAQWPAAVHLGGRGARTVAANAEGIGPVSRNAGGAAEQGDESRQAIREQSARLIERAKAEGFFWPDDSPIFAALQAMPAGLKGGGAEHTVYVVGEGESRFVIRATDNGFFGPRSDISPAQYLARLDDYSETFPSLQTRLIGVSESAEIDGHAVIWTAQTFVYGKKFATQALLSEAMARHGWDEGGYPGVPRFKHRDSGAIIEDAHTDNVFQDDNGDLYPFDVVVEALPTMASTRNPQTDTAAFKAWFKDSKVVDSDGKPLVVYHASTFGDFDTFDKSKQAKGMAGFGFYFTDREGSNIYTDYGQNFQADRDWQGNPKRVNVTPVFLRMENPLVVDDIAKVSAKYGKRDPGAFGQGRTYAGLSVDAQTAIQRDGYDGVIATEHVKRAKDGSYKVVEPGTKGAIAHPVYVVFEPTQVKSSLANSGAFNPASPSILASTRRTPAQAQAARTVTLNALAAQGIPQGNVTWTLDKKQRDARTTQARRVFQDRMIDARNIRDAIETATGQPLDDLLDVYQGENLMHGRAEEGIERIRRELVDPLKADMVQARRRANVSNEDVHRYLWAKHAQERNARIASINPAMPDGGSGLTNQEAQDILDAFDRAGKTAWLERIGRRVKAVRKNTLKTLLDSGQITQELHDKLDRMYQHYVPLRGKDGEGEQRIGAGRGIDVRGKPVQRALGRGSEPKDILGELVGDAERAVVQSAKAEVGRMLLRMALQFPNADVWQVEPVIIEPKFSEATGEVYLSIAQPDKETTIIVMHRGKPYSVKLVDPQLRDAVMRYGIEGWDGVAKVLGWANRWLSAVSTRFNPAFVGVNLIRDAIQGSIAIASELGGTALADAGKLYLPAMGAMWKAAKGAGDSSVPDARKSMVDWAREFAEAGGKTGYASLSDPETIQQRIEAEMASIGDLLRQRKPIMAVAQVLERSTIIHGIERANDAVENALRLAVYVHLRKSGRTQPKAAQYAKNVTINFNRRGQLTGALNALYLFFNASMQGGHRTLQLLKDPRVLTTLASMGAAQSAIALSAGMMKFEDDDETLWEQIPDYVREKAFVIPTGFSKTGDPQYIAIPMPFGFNLFTSVGGYPALLSSETWKKRQEHGPAGTLVNSFARSAIDAFSVVPLGEDAWWLPTLARMQRNFSANKDDLGNSIRSMNAQRGDGPRASAGKADTPELFRDIATALNRLGGGDEVTKPVQWLDYAPEDIEWMMSQVTGGLGSTVQQTMRAASRAGAGLELAPGDWPISSRIVGSQRRERVQQRMYYEARDRMEEGLERLRLAYAKEGLDGFESAKHDLGTAYDGVVIARYKTTNRERGYRRGDIRADEVTGRPIFVAVPGSTFDAYKQAMRAQDGYGDAIKSEYMDGEQPFAERLTDIDALQKERAAMTREFMRQWNN